MRTDIESLLVAQREKQEQSFTVKPVSLTLNRRQFLKATAVGSCGLMVGISLNASANASSAKQAAEFNPNAFIHLQKDGCVLIYCGRCEMGQGISTALPSVVADEMEADWSRVTVEQAEGDQDKYGSQATGGSASIRTMYEPMRKAGAVAREMLVAAAAKVWATSPDNCYAENHFVINKTITWVAFSGKKGPPGADATETPKSKMCKSLLVLY